MILALILIVAGVFSLLWSIPLWFMDELAKRQKIVPCILIVFGIAALLLAGHIL